MRKIFLIILFILMILTSCTTSYVCPPIVEYTTEEQKELAETLEKIDSPIVDRFIIDYGNLRNKIRICK